MRLNSHVYECTSDSTNRYSPAMGYCVLVTNNWPCKYWSWSTNVLSTWMGWRIFWSLLDSVDNWESGLFLNIQSLFSCNSTQQHNHQLPTCCQEWSRFWSILYSYYFSALWSKSFGHEQSKRHIGSDKSILDCSIMVHFDSRCRYRTRSTNLLSSIMGWWFWLNYMDRFDNREHGLLHFIQSHFSNSIPQPHSYLFLSYG